MTSAGPPFRRVLVANRGEIAVRIVRACHELGMGAIAIYSDADAGAAHVRMADAAMRVGPAAPMESYLRIDAVVDAALAAGADAVHPGYGFLAERAAFAQAVTDAGLVFVGPTAATIEALGDKLAARRTATAAGVAAVPGTMEAVAVDRPDWLELILAEADGIGFPLMVKAAAGGGGRGMRRVERDDDLAGALASGSREAESAFGDGAVYLERVIQPARHVEVQLLGDATGRVVAIGERDCSVQRRHQKLIEEAPAPGLSRAERQALHARAVAVASAAGLRNAATAEFLRAPDGAVWFLEMNTRLQVEHGVTELVSGLDIVREQFHLAAGRPLSGEALAAADRAASPTSHAIEVRLSAEDPGRDFAPAPGRITRWRMPSGPGVRVDTATEAGDRIPPEYDNLVAKLMVHAGDRAAAIARLRRALDEVEVGGIQTTLPFHLAVAHDSAFARPDELSTGWVAERWRGSEARSAASRWALLAAALDELDPSHRPGATAAPGPAEPAFAPARSAVTTVPRHATARPRAGSWRGAARSEGIDRWPR